MNLSKEQIKLLEENGYSFSYLNDSSNITLSDKDGNNVKGLISVEIVAKELIAEIKEEDEVYLSNIQVLELFEYEILSESPFEIISPDGDFIKGGFVNIIVADLRSKLKSS